MYENDYESHAQSESDWSREERDLDAHLERQEARARRELAEGLLEVSEFTGRAPRLGQTITVRMSDTWMADTLNGWLNAVTPKPVDTDLLEDPYHTCAYGHHTFRYVGGGFENAQYRCEDCGSTDPEGDTAPFATLAECNAAMRKPVAHVALSDESEAA